jgi:DNA polymerase lambda
VKLCSLTAKRIKLLSSGLPLSYTVIPTNSFLSNKHEVTHVILDPNCTMQNVVDHLSFTSIADLLNYAQTASIEFLTPSYITSLKAAALKAAALKANHPTKPLELDYRWIKLQQELLKLNSKPNSKPGWTTKAKRKSDDDDDSDILGNPKKVKSSDTNSNMVQKLTNRLTAQPESESDDWIKMNATDAWPDDSNDRFVDKSDPATGAIVERFRKSGMLVPLRSTTTTTTATSTAATTPPECKCDSPCTLHHVRIRGPHMGSTFWSCSKHPQQQCDFFQWDNHIIKQEAPPPIKTSPIKTSPSSSSTVPRCKCDKPAQQCTDTVLCKVYYKCAQPREDKCNYCRYEDDENSPPPPPLASLAPPPPLVSASRPFDINVRIADFLSALSSAHAQTAISVNDKWRVYNYKKASQKLRNFGLPLDHGNEASIQAFSRCQGIGNSTLVKIREFLATGGQSERLTALLSDPLRRAIKALSSVHGIGTSTAKSFALQGIASIPQLRLAHTQNRIKLTPVMQIGLKHYEDIQKAIPRDEVKLIGNLVQTAAQTLFPNCGVEIMGSYRRGAPTSHDVDCLITSTDMVNAIEPNCLMKVVALLQQQGVLVDHLALPSDSYAKAAQFQSGLFRHKNEDNHSLDDPTDKFENLEDMHKEKSNQTYMGVGVVKDGSGVCRRVDIKWYPMKQRAFAQLYFTGNAYFNRSMRLYSKIIGYSLSDHGLMKTQRKMVGGKLVILAKKESLAASTEEDIFRLIGLEWRRPEDRNSYDAVASIEMGRPTEEGGEDLEELSQEVEERPEWLEEGGQDERWDWENPSP